MQLNEQKRATRNGDVNNHIAEHCLQTKHQINWDCDMYNVFYRLLSTTHLESWFTNSEQTPLNRQQLTAPYKRIIDRIKQNLREND